MRTLRPQPTPTFRYSPLVAALACVLAPHAAMAAIHTVINANEFGPGSLYQAIEDANADPGCGVADAVQIQFSGPFVISPGVGSLPAIECGGAVVGNASGPKAVIDGSSYSYGGGCGLSASVVPNVVFRNLEVSNWSSGTGFCGNHFTVLASIVRDNDTGISGGTGSIIGDGTLANRNYIYGNSTGIYASYGGSINGNVIGTDQAGSTEIGNYTGIRADVDISITNNVISGNFDSGIYILGGSSITISGNKIGTNEAGTAAHDGLQGGGIYLEFSYGGVVVSNNTISGNNGTAIGIYNGEAIQISANRIGTNAAGNAAIPNGGGIEGYCIYNMQLANNTISGNAYGGTYFSAVDSSTITGNRIGVASSGTLAIPNGGTGLHLSFGECGTFDAMAKRGTKMAKSLQIGGSNNNQITGGNVIANNAGAGILIALGGQNRILGNSIHSNSDKNIALDMYGGPLPNDPGDTDDGVNSLQNWPTVDTVTHVGGNTQVNFTLDSLPGTYEIQLFKNAASGPPSGQTFMGSTFLTVSSGPAPGSYTIPGLHDHISLTATAPNGDTSELSIMGDVQLTPNRTINPLSVNFGNVPVDQVSGQRTITITSNGSAPLQITNINSSGSPSCYGGPICYGGDFMCSTTCSTFTDYAPGQSCTITGTFAPSFLGMQSTTINVCDNVSGSPTSITLSGQGIDPPLVSITPASHNFGGIAVGSLSPAQRFTVVNSSAFAVPIVSVTTLGQFRLISSTCAATLAPLAACDADVVFEPTSQGSLSGSLVVRNSAEMTPQSAKRGKAAFRSTPPVSASLSGIGVDAGALEMPSSVDLGLHLIGSAPNQANVELRNTGSAPINLTGISVDGPFTLVNPCPATLGPGESCQLRIGFTTTTDGSFNGTLTVMTDASGGSRTIPITARSQRVPRPVIRVAPLSMGFGDRLIGSQGAAQRITISNEGGAVANLGPIGSSSVEFLVLNTSCGPMLASGTSCFADVAMRPLGFSLRNGRITFTSNAEGSPHNVTLVGSGCRPNTAAGSRFGNRGNCSP